MLALAVLASIASANIIIKSEEAKQLIQSKTNREKRGITCWSKKCRKERFNEECTFKVCRDFEEFKGGSLNRNNL